MRVYKKRSTEPATDVGGEITPPEQQSPQQLQPPQPSSQPLPQQYQQPPPLNVPDFFPASRDNRTYKLLQNAGGRDLGPTGEPIIFQWKLNLSVSDCNTIKFRAFKKEAVVFGDCCGFGDIFGDFPIANGELSSTQTRVLGFSEDGIETYRKAYQFLRSALTHGGTWRLDTTLPL